MDDIERVVRDALLLMVLFGVLVGLATAGLVVMAVRMLG